MTKIVAKKNFFQIGITGSYGGLNLGDEAILHSIITQLRRDIKKVKITVFSRNPDDTRVRHKVDRVVAVRDAARDEVKHEIEPLDLLVFGGGGILFDGEVKSFLREVQIAKESGVPVFVYSISAGPLKDPSNHELVRECMDQAIALTVRDRRAKKILEDIGVRNPITVTADPAFLLEPERVKAELLLNEGIQKKQILVGMSVREPGDAAPDLEEEKYHTLLANVADFMVDRFGAHIVFVPMEKAMQDLQHSHAVVAKMLEPQHAIVLKGDYASAQVLSLMKNFKFAVGMRLHFLIFAALQGVPFVALPYAAKVHGLLEHFKIEMPPLDLVNAGRLIAHIDRSWDHRRSLGSQICNYLPEMKSNARKPHEMLLDLLDDSQLTKTGVDANKDAA